VTVELPEEGVFRVGVQEAQPGDSTTEGWQLAPKFKLAHEFLEFGDFVAEGGFSEIYRGTYKGRAVAIKKLKIWLLGEETLVEFQKEAEVLASLYHPNILVMVGITAFPSLCIVTPWAERGALDHYVYKAHAILLCLFCHLTLLQESNALPCELACRIQLGIARGALYLHSVRILHRDMSESLFTSFPL
jgi:serine/threonine protein kinase